MAYYSYRKHTKPESGVRGGSRFCGKGVRMYKGMGISFADFS